MRLAVGAAVAVSLACGGGAGPVASSPPMSDVSSERVEVVQSIYRSYSAGHPYALDELPWTTRMAEAVAAMQARDEMGLGSDPLIGGQDFELTDVRVTAVGDDQVEATFNNFGQPMRAVFYFVDENGSQRIDNIDTPDGSLRTLLTGM